MSPILLERADFIKLGIMATLLLPALFVSGFIFGYTRAEDHQVQQLAQVEIELPQLSTTAVAVREPMIPTMQSPGQDRDVDLADPLAEDDAMHHQHAQASPPAADIGKPGEARQQDLAQSKPGVVTAAGNKAEAADSKPAVLAIGGPHEPVEQDPAELMLDTSDEDSARYTVQVGLFGSADNAERKVDSLMSKRLNAYTTEYTNKKNKQLFNVRFGYFDSRKNALAALASYRSLFSGDGYLIRINR